MIGLDIGSKTIKVIELAKNGTIWNLKASGAVGYVGASPDKMTEDKEFAALAEIIKKLTRQVAITSRDINMSLPEALVFSRVIKFPQLTDSEVDAAVRWEAEQYIPIPIKEAIVQHSILERNDTTNTVSVLLVAAPRLIVEKYVRIARLANLTPVAAETDLIALCRSLASPTGVSLVLDMGAGSTDIAVSKNSKLAFSRSIPIGGEAFTRAVAQSFGINAQQAEEYKKTYGLSATALEGKVKASLDPIFRMVIDEVKKAISFYQSEEKGETPSSVILTGGAATMPEVVPYMTTLLGIETVLGDSFSKITLDAASAQALAPYSSLYSIAVGLALKED
jgi:type IV pilus assembly protein PilM